MTELPAGGAVHSLISAAAREHPGRDALVSRTGRLTYRELDLLADRLCDRLIHDGLERQSVVGLHVPRGLEQVVALLAVLKAGCAYLPLDPTYPAERLRYMARAANAARILTAGRGTEGGLFDGATVDVSDAADVARPSVTRTTGSGSAAAPVHPAELAYVLYTSGTTGRPKGVELTHGGLRALRDGLENSVWRGLGHSVVAWNASASFDASVQQWLRLCRGDTLVLLDEELRTDPAALVEYLTKQGVTDLDVVPSHLAQLTGDLAASGLPLRLLVGGEPLPSGLWQELTAMERGQGVRAWNLYGPTECTVDVTAAPVSGAVPHLGEPLPGVRCYVLDEWFRPVPQGELGELFVAGPGVGRGYRNLPGRTAAAFLPDSLAGDGGRMYRTGDLVRRDSSGRLEYGRRRDRQVKVRGHRVELGEIEATLRAMPVVVNAAAVLRTDLPSGPGIVAYLVLKPPCSTDTVRAWLSERLQGPFVPAAMVELEALPLNVNGKVDHSQLPPVPFDREPADDGPDADAGVAASGVERDIAEIWATVLGLGRVAPGDNIFELGADSLSVLRVINRCRDHFDVRMRTRLLFDNPVLRDFAAAVQNATMPPLHAAAMKEPRP
ncbi:non-ribosomal peptide synthetase [Streptomyces sp. NPDC006602]|uniref:non-ribosomal peptide synthetase n=1 Tax=Streptomyces sp. NPDC006602 TaxID=3364751 RepID=UPI0036C40A55